MKKIVLASASPRRRELLEMLKIKFDVIPDDSPETISRDFAPHMVVCELAKNKGSNVIAKICEEAIVISADTIVVLDNQILGKPKNEDDARKMLMMLSGNVHEVYTGVSVTDTKTNKNICFYERTCVKFRDLSDSEILAYIQTGEPMDKAGAYGIQSLGALFVEKIDGDYMNVVGLPVCELGKVLKNEFGINILGESLSD